MILRKTHLIPRGGRGVVVVVVVAAVAVVVAAIYLQGEETNPD